MTVSRAISSLYLFRSKIDEAVNLVPGMCAEDKLKAVQFWNMVSEKLQDIVNSSAADINAVALKMDEEESEKMNLEMNNANSMAQGNITTSDFMNLSSSYTICNDPNVRLHAAGMHNNEIKHFVSNAPPVLNQDEQSPHNSMANSPHIHHRNSIVHPDACRSDVQGKQMEYVPANVCDTYPQNIHLSPDVSILEVKEDSIENSAIIHSPRRFSHKNRNQTKKAGEENKNLKENKERGLTLKESVSQNHCDVDSIVDSSEDRCHDDSESIEEIEAIDENIISFVASNSEEIVEQNEEDPFGKMSNIDYTEDGTHLQVHGRPFCCDECQAKFTTKGNLIVHMRRHTGEKPFCCNKCNASFSTQGNLKRHIKTHSGEKPWHCNKCGSHFTEKKSLTVHMRRHTGERPYKCKECGKGFSQSSILQGHMATHLDIKMHLCEKCGKAFRQKSQLRIHRLRHENVRTFQCPSCSKSFLTKGELIRHQRTHTGQKPFNCDMCTRGFTRQQSLNEHKNRHYGLKPYKCKDCGKAFAEMSACYKHMKYHEKERKAEKMKEDELEAIQQASQEVTDHSPDACGVENQLPNVSEAPSYIAVVLNSKDPNDVENERNQAVSYFNSGLEEGNLVPNGIGVLTTINILTNASTFQQSFQSIS